MMLPVTLNPRLGTPVAHNPFAGVALEAFVPITESQREIWLATQLSDELNLAYNEGLEITLKGALDEAALRGALQTVINRHEGLRGFFSPDGKWMMVLKELPLDQVYESHDLRSTTEPLAGLAALDDREMTRAFDVERGPLVRFTLVRVAEEDYRLLFVAHHLICDGWSGAVVITEIGALYSAAVEGQPDQLKPPTRYGDYSLIEQEFRRSAEGMAHEKYWLDKLKDDPVTVDLPLDRPRPAERTFASGRIDYLLNAELVAGLRRTGATHGASLVTIMLAGFAALLNRLTGAEDLVIGLCAAGQSQHQISQLVGHCVNKLPLRLKPQRNARFSDFLKVVRGDVLDAQDHQGVTYGSLLPKLAIERDDSRPPLIAVTFNIDVRDDDIRHAGLQVAYRTMVRKSDSQELYFNVVDNGRDLALEACYNAGLFDAETIRRRVAEYEALLIDICRDANTVIADLKNVSDADAKLMASFNNTTKAIPTDKPIHRWVEAQAARTPDAVAVVSGGEKISYAELNRRANQLAHWLRAQGVAADAPVAVCVQRTVSAIVALLATLKSGGAYLPLDPEYPAERLAYMLEDAAPKVLLSNFGDAVPEAVTAVLRSATHTHLDLIRDAKTLDSLPAEDDSAAQSASTLAYVIYTSGSTGKPKGTRLEHLGPLNQYLHYIQALAIDERSKFLVFSSLAFDLTQRNLWSPLMAGGTVVLVDSPTYDALEIADLASRHAITHICCTPSAFYPLVDAQAGADFTKLQSLRRLALGGEVIQLSRLAAWLFSAQCQAVLTNCYGPTEASANVALFQLDKDSVVSGSGLPIGQAITNVQLHVLDTNGAVLPLGVTGELHIGGLQLARDYLGQPALTAEKFIQHPTLGRLYRTGDLCRRRNDGLLEYVGRLDFQVKLRGFRVELGEIEAALAAHEAIAEAAADIRLRGPDDPRLVAWISLRAGAEEPTASVLRSLLRAQLPAYMVPQQFMVLPALPKLGNGKLNRKALPDPFAGSGARAVAPKEAPRGATEEAMAQIWRDVLGTAEVSRDDRFLELGGHSLLAVQLAGRIQKQFGQRMPLKMVMLEPLSVMASRFGPAPATAGETTPAIAPPAAKADLKKPAGLPGVSPTLLADVAIPARTPPARTGGSWLGKLFGG